MPTPATGKLLIGYKDTKRKQFVLMPIADEAFAESMCDHYREMGVQYLLLAATPHPGFFDIVHEAHLGGSRRSEGVHSVSGQQDQR